MMFTGVDLRHEFQLYFGSECTSQNLNLKCYPMITLATRKYMLRISTYLGNYPRTVPWPFDVDRANSHMAHLTQKYKSKFKLKTT